MQPQQKSREGLSVRITAKVLANLHRLDTARDSFNRLVFCGRVEHLIRPTLFETEFSIPALLLLGNQTRLGTSEKEAEATGLCLHRSDSKFTHSWISSILGQAGFIHVSHLRPLLGLASS